MSIAMGCICTYASYFNKQTKLTTSAVQISVIDCMVAILSGLMIFPAAFSVGVSPDSGPSLIFITLPNVFSQAFAAIPVLGYVVSLLFFTLLSLAALTSLMSLHEVSTAFFQEEFRLSRKRAALLVTVSTMVIGAICSLSLGSWNHLSWFGKSLFDIFDFVTGQIFLPVVGFLTCILIGYLFLVKYVCPMCILFIFLHQLGWV